jgi:hypothetical protein
MNKKIFTLTCFIVFAVCLVLTACGSASSIAQTAIANVVTALPAASSAATTRTPIPNGSSAQPSALGAAIAQTSVAGISTSQPAGSAESLAQTAIADVSTSMPAGSAAIAQTAIAQIVNALPSAQASTSGNRPTALAIPTIPLFPGLQQLNANDSKAIMWLNAANQLAEKTGYQFDGKAYVTSATINDITTFYNNALKGWQATPPSTSSFPTLGNFTIWVYSQTSQNETLTLVYTPYDAAANKFLLITELIWQ